MTDTTTITVSETNRDRLADLKAAGKESYNDVLSAVLDEIQPRGDRVTVENITDMKIRLAHGRDWLAPGEQTTVHEGVASGALSMGRVKKVED